MYNNNYTSIEDPIKRETTDQSPLSRKKNLCIYLIGFITGALLLLLVVLLLPGSKQIGMNSYVSTPIATSSSSSATSITTASTSYVFFSDLNVDDTVKMQVYNSAQVLRNPSSSNKVRPVSNRDSDRVKWTVGYDSTRDAYSFKNKGQNCYLKTQDTFLKCLSGLEDKSYWKADADTVDEDGLKSQQLKNYANDKCPAIFKNYKEIDMETLNCDGNDASTVRIIRYN